MPTYGDEEKPEFDTRLTEQPPKDAEPDTDTGTGTDEPGGDE